jgi:ATP-dependent DNA helicase HFM1/MER3
MQKACMLEIIYFTMCERVLRFDYSVDESERPVKLRKVVLTYPDAASDFRFDMSLNYKLSTVIHQYSDQKPTLIFCSTRKSVQQAATVVVKDSRFVMSSQRRQK